MALIIETSKPLELLKAIKKAIDEKKVETWSYDNDGDFTHTPVQWKNKAWFRPKTSIGQLKFGLLNPKDANLSKPEYSIYHGRFIEMLLDHFDGDFTSAKATAQKTDPDFFT